MLPYKGLVVALVFNYADSLIVYQLIFLDLHLDIFYVEVAHRTGCAARVFVDLDYAAALRARKLSNFSLPDFDFFMAGGTNVFAFCLVINENIASVRTFSGSHSVSPNIY